MATSIYFRRQKLLKIRKIVNKDYILLKDITVSEDQQRFIGTINDILENIPATSHYHVIEDDEEIVGIFNLDTAYSVNYDFTMENELGLRAFIIDQKKQNRGYGKAAVMALKGYIKKEYPGHSSVSLTVNCKNPNAYRCYLSGGFQNTGELYNGGLAGPQYIMRMKI